MLKIKDDVELEDLEKFGFIKIEWNDILRPSFQMENNIATMGIDRKNKEIDCNNYLECIELGIYQDLLYDLITAGLVEKIEE